MKDNRPEEKLIPERPIEDVLGEMNENLQLIIDLQQEMIKKLEDYEKNKKV